MKTILSAFLLFFGFYSFGQVFGEEVQISNTFSYPTNVHLFDSDNDGDLDILCSVRGDRRIVLYENDGFANFSNPMNVSNDSHNMNEVFTSDLNNDGHEDILAASQNGIFWYPNNGEGGFLEEKLISNATSGWIGIQASDINGDSHIDVVVGSSISESVYWFENNGSGIFNSMHLIATDLNNLSSVFSIDLDMDGSIDVLVSQKVGAGTNNNGDTQRIMNNGDGTFQNAISLPLDILSSSYINAADMDADGSIDILCTTNSTGNHEIIFYANNGFNEYSTSIITSDMNSLRFVNTSDIDDDGDLDVLITSTVADKVSWFENLGNGDFGEETIISTNNKGANCAAAGDLNGDGNTDVVVTSRNDDKLSLHLNDGNAIFNDQFVLDQSETSDVTSLNISDLDGDGDLDIIAASIFNYPLSWYENIGNGEFGDQAYFDINENEQYESVTSGDLNGDGLKDYTTISYEGDEDSGDLIIRKFIQSENNEFNNSILQEISLNTFSMRLNSVQIFDLDLDEDLDIVVVCTSTGQVLWYENNGVGEFSTEQVIIDNGTFSPIYDASFADFDEDGDLDALIAKWDATGGIVVFENNELQFTASAIISEEINGSTVKTADVDQDGDIDIVYSLWDNDLSWAENDGSGGFESSQYLTTDVYYPHNIDLGDLDNDGDVDIVLSNTIETEAYWIENEGNGSFGEIQIFSNKINISTDIHMADIDADGDLDVISSSRFDDKIALFPNIYGEGCTDSNACNFNPASIFDNGTCCYDNCGCTDIIAENFSETATCDDGSCTYVLGCMNENAINYDQEATLDDDSCEFLISGVVYHNENLNFTQEENELGLNQQSLVIQPNNITILTNELGQYSFITSDFQCSITLMEDPIFPIYMNPTEFVFNPHETSISNYDFGISSLEDFYGSETILLRTQTGLCNDNSYYKVGFINTGNTPVDGIIELEMDPLFQGYSEISPIDSVNGNLIYFSFEDLAPGLAHLADIALITPTTDQIGEYFTHTARVYGYSESTEISSSEKEFTAEVACAYDPNDKQAFPLGYTEEHWLLPETEQEFLVRFQNTGNAPAQDVLIQDTIDVNYDLSTFRIITNSHSVMTTINEETRVIDFFYEDIQLPDSVNNEPESHGFVSYAITPYTDLAVGTELNNTAYIYFDNNPPIITNTTWNTIHECGGEADFQVSNTNICTGETLEFSSLYSTIETYEWQLEGEIINSEPSFFQTFDQAGEYSVELTSENLICNASTIQIVSVYDFPIAQFTQEVNLLTASEGETYQWFLNGEEIIGATSQQFYFTVDGIYSVEVTNGGVCTSSSEGVSLIVGISEHQPESVSIYPNPLTDITYLEFESSQTRTIQLFNAMGQEVRVWENVSNQKIEILKTGLSAGSYLIQITEAGNMYSLKLMVE
ncbi:MAG: FG-GAP-like repeat-containing protein [Flavobacteriales bacterium]